MTSDRRPLTRWVVAAAAIVPAALAVIAARVDRPTVGPDAVSYIAVADSLRTGGGLGFFLERPLTTWPPLWPALIAVGETITGWRGDLVALALNVVLLVVTMLRGNADHDRLEPRLVHQRRQLERHRHRHHDLSPAPRLHAIPVS